MAMKMPTLDLTRKIVEPQKRLRGGSFGWAIHRFQIKGGITLPEMMRRDLSEPSLLGRLFTKGD